MLICKGFLFVTLWQPSLMESVTRRLGVTHLQENEEVTQRQSIFISIDLGVDPFLTG